MAEVQKWLLERIIGPPQSSADAPGVAEIEAGESAGSKSRKELGGEKR